MTRSAEGDTVSAKGCVPAAPLPGVPDGFRVQGSGFRVQGSGFRVQGSGFRVQGSGFRVQGSGFIVQGSGFRIYAGFRVHKLGPTV
jgi:hypothetical protein